MIKLAIFGLLVLGLISGLLALEDRLVYFPTPTLVATPVNYDLEYERVTLHTADGLALMGWVMPQESERWLIYFHGNGENVSRYLPLMPQLHALGFNVLLFDYRGFGESEGSPGEAGLYEDAMTSYRFLLERGIQPENIYLYGFSLGTGVAVELATRVPVAGVVLEAPYTSLPDAARHSYPLAPTFLMRNRYNSLEKIGDVNAPLLFLHARDDLTVPFEQGRRLYERANEPKRFVEIGGGHSGMLRTPTDPRGLRAIDEVFGAGSATH